MSRHDTELTIVDSPDSAAAAAAAAPAETDAIVDPATELRSPTVEESAQAADTVSRAEFEQLKAERDQLLDRLARLQAEFENARKRSERERAEFRDYATGNVVEQFLPVLDHFELALKASGSVEQVRSGVELIVKQMGEVLRQLQVTPVPAVGEPFDPRVHEALGTVERDDIPDHYVAEEVRRGYRLRERLLRPAMVRVASNPNQKSE
ncbi:MAG TPA: nucleotide exchange factor GrpE [Terracidiphilus sp.]|nr:nucleotide exchange factor GrpE [Terracidiphilus sp.]